MACRICKGEAHATMENLCPDCKRVKKWLEENGSVIGFYVKSINPEPNIPTQEAIDQIGTTEDNQLGSLLREAERLICGERQDAYGSPARNWKCVAALWTAYIRAKFNTQDITILPQEAADMMILMKVGRSATGQSKPDNYADICGYADIAGTVLSKEK